MLVIGVVGGVASGKTTVTNELGRLGAVIVEGDRIGHEVLRDETVCREIRQRWGVKVFDRFGQVDRSSLARVVFGPPPWGPEELKQLETLTHPRIGARLEEELDALRDSGTLVAVLDAAVMFKAGWDRLCDKVLFVKADRGIRLARARQRGWTEEVFARREAAQKSLDIKRADASVVIDNSGSLENTQAQVIQIWYNIVSAA